MVMDRTPMDLREYKSAAILKDGTALNLRAIRGDDVQRLLSLFSRFSARTIFLRFHDRRTTLSLRDAEELCGVDYVNTFAVVATTGEGTAEKFIAVGRYTRTPGTDEAVFALVVEDAYQGKGIGTVIAENIAPLARSKGIRRLVADVAAGAAEPVKMLEDLGYRSTESAVPGIVRMALELVPDELAEEKSAAREETATVASLRAFMKPKSVAVIGASHRPAALGYRVFTSLLYQGFSGTVFPVNSRAESVASVKAYPSILDVPDRVDLAVIVVPAESVQEVVEQCGRKGVRGIIVISAGFGEAGPEGEKRQEKLLNTVRSYGMRMVGPNCMGIINTDPEVNMNASFAPTFPPVGRIAFGTQSGGLGLAILDYARSLNIGMSTFASIGNRADVSSNDLLLYWKEDPATDVVLLYLESFGNPGKFARVARDVACRKPIVAVKSGRTAVGARAAASHTGAMASTEVAAEALFRQTGIIRVNTLEELFDTGTLLANQPLPPGRKVAIVTNGGGPGILTADACAGQGLEIPLLSEKTRTELRSFLSPQASLGNPVDMTADASYDEYSRALRLLAKDEVVDVAVAIVVSPVKNRTEDVSRAIREVAPEFRQAGKTLIASFMGQHGVMLELVSGGQYVVPSFSFPEASAIAIAKACEYAEWLKRPKGLVPVFTGTNKERAKQIVKSGLAEDTKRPLWLNAESVSALLECYGIKTVPSRFAATSDDAMKIATELGFPVVLKLASKTIMHKTDVGGVALDLRSAMEVSQAFAQIRQNMQAFGVAGEMEGVTVQPMITSGIETIVGVSQDPSFGPIVLFGLGGIYTELFKDVAARIHPLTDVDAREMVQSVKAYQLLEGWRGSKRHDVASIEELLLRVSVMIEDIEEIRELDLNPVKVQEEGKGYVTVDAKVLLG